MLPNSPKTIEELKDFCDQNGYTASLTRFFVGKNYTSPKAFGIYKDEETGDFIVYKNKADGSRYIRYQGPDEAFAVSELYERLIDEVKNQKLHCEAKNEAKDNYHVAGDYQYSEGEADNYYNDNNNNRNNSNSEDNSNKIIYYGIMIVMMIISLITGFSSGGHSGSSQYYDDNSYYSRSSDSYDSYNDSWSSSDWDSGNTDWDSDW